MLYDDLSSSSASSLALTTVTSSPCRSSNDFEDDGAICVASSLEYLEKLTCLNIS